MGLSNLVAVRAAALSWELDLVRPQEGCQSRGNLESDFGPVCLSWIRVDVPDRDLRSSCWIFLVTWEAYLGPVMSHSAVSVVVPVIWKAFSSESFSEADHASSPMTSRRAQEWCFGRRVRKVDGMERVREERA